MKLIDRVYERLPYIPDGVVASRSWAVTLSLAQYKTEMNQEMPFCPAQRLSYLTHLRLKPTVNHLTIDPYGGEAFTVRRL